MKMGKILERTPDEIRNRICDNIEQQGTALLLDGREFDSESKFLLDAFDWSESIESFDFWNSYHEFLVNFEKLK